MSLRSAGRPLARVIAMTSSRPATAGVELDERGVQAGQVLVIGGRDDVEILRRAAVTVDLRRDPADDREVDAVAMQRGHELGHVEGGGWRAFGGQRDRRALAFAFAPASSSWVTTRFHDADSASRCAGVRLRA